MDAQIELGYGRFDDVFALTASEAWVCGPGGDIRHTTDAGVTWTPQVSATTAELLDLHFVDGDSGWAVGTAGTILQTVDGGVDVDAQTSGVAGYLWSVWAVDASTAWASGDNGVILHTTDGGAHWDPQVSGTGQWLGDITFVDAQTGWAVGSSNAFLHTTDGGATRAPQTLPPSRWFNCSSVAFANASVGWAAAHEGDLLKTTDGGATWTATALKCDTDLLDVQALGARTAFVVGRSGTVLAHDGVAPKAYAPSRASVVRGRKATLKYKVTDALPNGAAAAVTIKVKKAGGKTVKTLRSAPSRLGGP